MELDAPDLGRRRLERGDGRPRVDVEDADEAVERHGGGERARGVGGEGDDPERVAPDGGPRGGEVVGAPGADGLVERPRQEHRRGAVVGGGRPRRRPDGLLVGAVHGLEPRELHRRDLGRDVVVGERREEGTARRNPRLARARSGRGRSGECERGEREERGLVGFRCFF